MNMFLLSFLAVMPNKTECRWEAFKSKGHEPFYINSKANADKLRMTTWVIVGGICIGMIACQRYESAEGSNNLPFGLLAMITITPSDLSIFWTKAHSKNHSGYFLGPHDYWSFSADTKGNCTIAHSHYREQLITYGKEIQLNATAVEVNLS